MSAPLKVDGASQPPETACQGLAELQGYYARAARERGYDNESARDCLLLLIEEVGELARAIRKVAGLKRETGYAGVEIGAELADVQLYLLHLANVLGLELADAVARKEHENHKRFLAREVGP